jgi:hypothetical protein
MERRVRANQVGDEVKTAKSGLTPSDRPQPVHALDEVRLRSLEREVVVIAHESVGVDAPAHEGLGFADRCEKGLRFGRGEEEISPVITAVDDVVDRPWELDPELASHGTEGAGESGGERGQKQRKAA